MRFRYLGESPETWSVQRMGPTVAVRFHQQSGEILEVRAPNQETGFLAGRDIGLEITDERVIRHMLVDKRFEQIG